MVNHLKGTPAALVLIAGTIFFFNLGSTQLWDDDEPKNASCGREMLERGNWTVPIFNDELRSHKPVLLYWAMIASYSLTGITEFGARLPSAMAGIGTVLLCYYLGRKLYDQTVGFVAGVLLASGLMFAVLSRAATPDAILIFWSTAALCCFVYGICALRGGQFVGFESAPADPPSATRLPIKAAVGMYISMGLAVLTKGPIGLLLPMSVVAIYTIFFQAGVEREAVDAETHRWRRYWQSCRALLAPARLWRISRDLRLWMGAGIVVAVALPWYVAVTVATDGQWLTGFIGTHNVHRFLHPMEGHSGPVYYYVIAILAGFFPASCFLPIAVIHAVRDQRRRHPSAHAHAFLLTWVACYLTFFSLAATKLPNYVAPCYPALALLTGYWLSRALRVEASPRFWLWMGLAAFGLASIALTAGLCIASVQFMEAESIVVVGGIVPLLGGIVCLYFLWHQKDRQAILSFATSCVLFTVTATGIVADRVSTFQTSSRIARQLAEIEAESASAAPRIATYRYTKPNVVFYLGKPVPCLASDDQMVQHLEENATSFVVLPKDVYTQLTPRLPADVGVIHSESKFFQPEQQIVIIGRQPRLAQHSVETASKRQRSRTEQLDAFSFHLGHR